MGELRAQEGEKKFIEGYFAVFNSRTQLWPGCYEEVLIGAFDETLSNDIRVLTNHDTPGIFDPQGLHLHTSVPSPEVTAPFYLIPSPEFSQAPWYSLPDHLCRFGVR